MVEKLSPRSAAVLDAVVEEFILAGEPVASATVAARLAERLSSATIRNVMAALEERGLLYQPHTSAGRMPTALGYEVYASRLVAQGRLHPVDEGHIRDELQAAHLEISGLLQRVCSLLSEMSSHVGVVLAPPPADTSVQHIEFVRLEAGGVLVVFVTGGGMVHTRAVELDRDLPEADLQAAAAYLLDRFGGRTLRELRDRVVDLVEENRAQDRRQRLALFLGARSLGSSIEQPEVLVEGAVRLLDSLDFSGAEVLQSLLATVEEGSLLGRLLTEHGVRGSVRLLIGADRLPQPLDGCTLITAGYSRGPRPLGVLGVLGPTRMEYARAIPLVTAVARATSDVFTERYT